MEKVYFSSNTLIVNDLSELYELKYIDLESNKESNTILSWTKNTTKEESLRNSLNIKVDVRLYSSEIDASSFEFLLRYETGKFLITPLTNTYRYIFTGETLKKE